MPSENSPILFFDGVCGLCNHFVDLLFKIDKKHIYRVATLQGETAQKLLPKEKLSELNSLIVYRNGQMQVRSQAVLGICADLGGPYKFLTIFQILPTPFLDLIYDVVARYRYRVFGKTPVCRIPLPDERARFLD